MCDVWSQYLNIISRMNISRKNAKRLCNSKIIIKYQFIFINYRNNLGGMSLVYKLKNVQASPHSLIRLFRLI